MPDVIYDSAGNPIGVYRDNQDPNFPQRFVEDPEGNRFVDVGAPDPVAEPAPVEGGEG